MFGADRYSCGERLEPIAAPLVLHINYNRQRRHVISDSRVNRDRYRRGLRGTIRAPASERDQNYQEQRGIGNSPAPQIRNSPAPPQAAWQQKFATQRRNEKIFRERAGAGSFAVARRPEARVTPELYPPVGPIFPYRPALRNCRRSSSLN
jgi:hypothetical protein